MACQIDIPATTDVNTRDFHLAATAQKIRSRLEQKKADIVVLPELSSTDYSRAAFDQLDVLAEPLDGASFQTWSKIATEFDVHVVYGFPHAHGSGVSITMAVVSPQGTLAGYYDKLHLCQYGASMEKEYFVAGQHLFTFELNGFILAPIICYDIRIPELARTLALEHGVDVILHCGAYFRDDSFPTWHDFARTRALENQLFLLSLNRAGQDYGNSVFCYPWMDKTLGPRKFPAHDESIEYIEVARERLIEARRTYTFLHDRRASYDLPVQHQTWPLP